MATTCLSTALMDDWRFYLLAACGYWMTDAGVPAVPQDTVPRSLSSYYDDERLVDRARRGEHGAFRQLFELYSPLVYRIAYRMVGSVEEASDLTQDVFVRAYERLPSLRQGMVFKAWITRIAINLVQDARRRRRLETTSLDAPAASDPTGIVQELPDTGPQPEQGVLAEELTAQIQAALLRLSPEHRSVIVLHHLENLPVEVISMALKVPAGTVKSRLARARAELRRHLESYLTVE